MLEVLKILEDELARTIASFSLSQTPMGQPHHVEKALKETERLFQNVTKALPSQRNAYESALKFLRGQLNIAEDDSEFDTLVIALCEPIKEQGGKRLIGSGYKFDSLLKYYETQANEDNLWRVTWYGLLSAYFSFDVSDALEDEITGWYNLRSFLERTWPNFSNTTGITPDWVVALKQNSTVLTTNPCKSFARDFLSGNESNVKSLSDRLGIPKTSWFWHQLVLDVAKEATELADDDYKKTLQKLIQLLSDFPVYRDEAVKLILTRYYQCKDRSANELLLNYVIAKNVWKNPKLKFAGIATSWNQVNEEVWRMVLGWVTESNLRLFFQLLDGRNASDSGRFAFWSKYLNQIGYTKLIFGEYTKYQAKSNQELATLLSQEEGISALLSSSDLQVDAFLMEIGDLIIVEFSKQPNAAYLYKKGSLPFDIHAKRLSDGTSSGELKAGYYHGVERITHGSNWEYGAKQRLANHGIYPDRPGENKNTGSTSEMAFKASSQASVEKSAPNKSSSMPFTMGQLKAIVAFSNATIEDNRPEGRLWVNHNQQSSYLSKQLQAWGFIWANKRDAWYYPE